MTNTARLVLGVFVATLASRCGTVLIPELTTKGNPLTTVDAQTLRHHVLMFDFRGEMKDPAGGRNDLYIVKNSTPYPPLPVGSDAFNRYVANMIDDIKSQKTKYGKAKVLIFFHGGLNTRADALKRSAHDIVAMREDPEIYPIFVNWQSSADASYKNHLVWIKNGQDIGSKGWFLLPFQLVEDVTRTIVGIPIADALQASDFYRTGTTRSDERIVVAEDCTTSLDFRQGREDPNSSPAREWLTAIPTLLLTKWWTAGLLASAGAEAWSSMNYTADRLFYSDAEMHHKGNGFAFQHPSVSGDGALARFLECLAQSRVLDERDDIVLVGHSAGTIVINAVLGSFGNRLPIHTLVYMAPACPIGELMPGGKVAQFLEHSSNRQLYILALHEQAELKERWHLDLTPRGSLLVWLDEILQRKNSELGGMMMGRVRNLRTHAHLISCDLYNQIHITAYDEDPAAVPWEQPQRHSDFGTLNYWKEETWRPASEYLARIPTTMDPANTLPKSQR